MPPPIPSLLDQNQILQGSYDETTGTLRTTATATVVGGDITVETSHTHDSIRLGDGTDYFTSTQVGPKNGLDINVINSSLNTTSNAATSSIRLGDGNILSTLTTINGHNGLDVNLINSSPISVSIVPVGSVFQSYFNDVAAVGSGMTVQIGSYTVPVGKTALLQQVSAGGDNIAIYYLYLNGVLIDQQRTYFGGSPTTVFSFNTGVVSGYALQAGDQITVFVNNFRPSASDFTSRIQVIEN